jgi:hypothetical protein
MLDRGGIVDDEGTLAKVIQDEGGIDERKPGALERLRPEMADVGVEGFAPGDGEQDHAHDDDSVAAVVDEVADPPVRREGNDHLGMLEETVDAESGESEEPHDHDRPEGNPDAGGAMALHQKETDEDADGDADDDVLGNALADLLQALDGGKHGDRRCDHAVSVEQGGPEKHDENDEGGFAGASLFIGSAEEREQGEHAAFALGGGAAEDGQVLERDHDRERPEHQGNRSVDHLHAIDAGLVARVGETFPQGIKGTGADVAEDDAERHQGKRPERSGMRFLHEAGRRTGRRPFLTVAAKARGQAAKPPT